MGWTTWCTDGTCGPHPEICTDAEVRSVAVAMKQNGMLDAGCVSSMLLAARDSSLLPPCVCLLFAAPRADHLPHTRRVPPTPPKL